MSIAERFKNIRKSLGISQRELADKIKVSHSYISNIESNKRIPSAETLIKFHETFSVSADYVLFGEQEVEEKKDESAYIEIIKNLTYNNSQLTGTISTIINNLYKEEK